MTLLSWSAEANAELAALKKQTRDLTAQAVKSGILIKPLKCSRCGSKKKLEAHHPDYLAPLVVTWFCQSCHRKLHACLNKEAAQRLVIHVPVPRERKQR